ncbi:MAG: hypothetical protein E5W82_10525 [Mesorhizobium sp.]|nr:MAG: hypothetical protein E5W82_10525 [Mesorhizobium sp.]
MTMAHILEQIRKQSELALIYADDGALRTAARLLNELAAEVLAAAEEKDRALDKLIATGSRADG